MASLHVFYSAAPAQILSIPSARTEAHTCQVRAGSFCQGIKLEVQEIFMMCDCFYFKNQISEDSNLNQNMACFDLKTHAPKITRLLYKYEMQS